MLRKRAEATPWSVASAGAVFVVSLPPARVAARYLLLPIERAESAAEPDLLLGEKVHGFFLPGNRYLLVPGDVYVRVGWN
jgi:hypothetical protein